MAAKAELWICVVVQSHRDYFPDGQPRLVPVPVPAMAARLTASANYSMLSHARLPFPFTSISTTKNVEACNTRAVDMRSLCTAAA